MRNKKIFVIFLVLIFGAFFLIQSVVANGSTMTISTVAEKDSYVESDDPTSNYGGKDWLIFGDYIFGWNEAYLYFNFSDKPAGWTKAEISIDMYSVSETFNVTVSLINDTWGEYTINWLNKPEHREIITTFIVAEGKIYKFDITNYIEGDGISICLNASDYYQNGYVQGHSKEGYWSWAPEDAPQLIWTYSETADITITSPSSFDVWDELNTYTIKWTSVGSIDKVVIGLYKGTEFIEYIATYTDNDGKYDWYISSLNNYKGKDYSIGIWDYYDSNVYDFSNYFSINIAEITVISPTSLSVLRVGEKHTIKWTSIGSIDKVAIELYKGSKLFGNIVDFTKNDGEFDWTVGFCEVGSDYSICIRDYDDSDVYDFTAEFTIENPIILIIIIAIIITSAIIGIGVVLIIFKKKGMKREISPEDQEEIKE